MKRIVFCGVGALGSTAVLLLRNLEAELVLIDGDRVDSKNLLSQAFVKASLGKNKAEALKLQLANFWAVKATAHPVRLVDTNVEALLAGAQLVVDAFDNRQSRELLSAHCQRHRLPLVHGAVSAGGDFGLVRWEERFVADAEDAPGQATCQDGAHLPFIGVVGAALARAVQDYVQHQRRQDVMISLRAVTPTSD